MSKKDQKIIKANRAIYISDAQNFIIDYVYPFLKFSMNMLEDLIEKDYIKLLKIIFYH